MTWQLLQLYEKLLRQQLELIESTNTLILMTNSLESMYLPVTEKARRELSDLEKESHLAFQYMRQ